MIRVTGMIENYMVTPFNDVRSINEKLIKYLSKYDDMTVINFIDGSKLIVEESINTLEARINLSKDAK